MSISLIIAISALVITIGLGIICGTKIYKNANELKKELIEIENKIREIQGNNKTKEDEYREITKLFENSSLNSLWKEFSETLYMQRVEDEDGILRTENIRATVPSEYFFSETAVIDLKLETEFYKHVPGMFPAGGIILTFFGLIWGLINFNPTDLGNIQAGVATLLDSVRDAFMCSVTAIAMSIIILMIERRTYKSCTECLNKLQLAIDNSFDLGIGNEFLERIATSTEESATQSKQLKDGLVSELRPLLQNLVDNQINELKPMLEKMVSTQLDANQKLLEQLTVTTATLSQTYSNTSLRMEEVYKEASKYISDGVSNSIQTTFEKPLAKISDTVQIASSSQSQAAEKALQSLLENFIKKMENSFGNQLVEAVKVVSGAQDGMKIMASEISTLIEKIREVGTSSHQAVSTQINQTLSDMKNGQQKLMDQLQNFLLDTQEKIGSGQSEMSLGLTNTMQVLGEKISNIIEKIDQSNTRTGNSQEKLMVNTNQMAEKIKDMTETQMHSIQKQIDDLNEKTTIVLENIANSGHRYLAAAEKMESAIQKASQVVSSGSTMLENTRLASDNLSSSSEVISNLLEDYKIYKNEVANLISIGRQDAESRSRVLANMREVLDHISEYHQEEEEHLEEINDILIKNFDSYCRKITETTNTFNSGMTEAAAHLKSTIDDLNETLEEFNEVFGNFKKTVTTVIPGRRV